jgi:cell division protein YceG involved in septum cleavage
MAQRQRNRANAERTGVIKYPVCLPLCANRRKNQRLSVGGATTLFKSMSYDEIINIISQITKPFNSVTVTITEGSEIKQTARKLSEPLPKNK